MRYLTLSMIAVGDRHKLENARNHYYFIEKNIKKTTDYYHLR